MNSDGPSIVGFVLVGGLYVMLIFLMVGSLSLINSRFKRRPLVDIAWWEAVYNLTMLSLATVWMIGLFDAFYIVTHPGERQYPFIRNLGAVMLLLAYPVGAVIFAWWMRPPRVLYIRSCVLGQNTWITRFIRCACAYYGRVDAFGDVDDPRPQLGASDTSQWNLLYRGRDEGWKRSVAEAAQTATVAVVDCSLITPGVRFEIETLSRMSGLVVINIAYDLAPGGTQGGDVVKYRNQCDVEFVNEFLAALGKKQRRHGRMWRQHCQWVLHRWTGTYQMASRVPLCISHAIRISIAGWYPDRAGRLWLQRIVGLTGALAVLVVGWSVLLMLVNTGLIAQVIERAYVTP